MRYQVFTSEGWAPLYTSDSSAQAVSAAIRSKTQMPKLLLMVIDIVTHLPIFDI